MMTTTFSEVTAQRTESRTRKVRPSYLNPETLARAAENGEARLVARLRKQRGE